MEAVTKREERAMAIAGRLDRFQQRHRWAGFPLAVIYKFVDDQGTYLAALITYYGFLSFFPLLLLLSSVLGFLLQDNPELQQRILHSALSQFPVIGQQLGDPRGLRGSLRAVVIGGLTSLYGGLGVAQATQHAMNTMWAVPRNERPNPLRSRLRSLLLLGTVGVAVLGTTVLSGLGSSGHAFGVDLGTGPAVLAGVLSMLLNAAVVLIAFRVSTVRLVSLRQLAPGAGIAAVAWQILQLFGTAFVGRVVKDSSATNSVFALVLGLIAWIFLAALALLLSTQINVVRVGRLYPRALLTPFTDNVDLTAADRAAYSGYATAQRAKGFESVDVSFDNDGKNADGRAAAAVQEPEPRPGTDTSPS